MIGIVIVSSLHIISEPEDFVTDAKISAAAFECAILAEIAGLESEKKRLFEIGFNASSAAISKYEESMSSVKYIDSMRYPLFRKEGPSIDFRIGMYFEELIQSSKRELTYADEYGQRRPDLVNDPDFDFSGSWPKKANIKYKRNNCALIGR